VTVSDTTPAKPPLLELDKLSVSFGGLKALSEFDLQVAEGEIVSVIGPNGAGKTTLFNAVSGFRRLTSGVIRLAGEPITALPPYAIARRGLVRTFQKTEVFPSLSIFDCVRIGFLNRFRASLGEVLFGSRRLSSFIAAVPAKVEAVLDIVGLADKASAIASELSYGEQRLLEVAVGLAAEPLLLLLDEPASGLNAEEAERFGDVIFELRGRGITVLLVEHNMNLVMAISDKVVVLHHGEKIAEGTPETISSDSAVVSAYLGRDWGGNA
jgi:branched-chain amino acid transport system ATP-binding protein